jgi:4-coumarate--CoA ligase
MYHAMAQTIFIALAPVRGIPVYIMPKFDFLQVLENVQKFRSQI